MGTNAWAAVGDTFTANTTEGVAVTYKVLTEDGTTGTVQVGNGSSAAVATSTTSFTIPASVTNGDITYAVTAVGEKAFNGCTGMTSFVIPAGVSSVGNFAFNGCTSLAELAIEDSNETLTMGYNTAGSSSSSSGKGLFKDCPLTTVYVGRNLDYSNTDNDQYGRSPFARITTITNATIGDAVTILHAQLFRECTGISSIVVPDHVTSLEKSAFYGCSGLEEITLPASLQTLGIWVFGNCTSLTTLTLPNNITSIGESAFRGCTGLTSITLPSNLTSIGTYAFRGSSSLTSIEIPDGVTTIPDYAFYDCTSLATVSLPAGLTTINQNAFYNCDALTSVQIPDAVTTIGTSAFASCENLATVTISENSSLTTLGNSAFNGYNKLASIYLPPTVTSIGNQAFRLCTYLSSVYIDDLAAWCSISFGDSEANPLQNGTNGVDLYLNETKVENLEFPSNVTTIGDRAFYHCRSLKSVHIPNTVTSIGNETFRLCANLTSMTIAEDNNLESIGLQFIEATGITEFSWPSNLTTIGPSVFYGADKLETVHIPNTVTAIGDYAFYLCSNLDNITIPSSVTSIGNNAFYYCQGLHYVYCDAETAPGLGNHAWTSTTDTRYYQGYSRQRLLIYPYGSNYSSWAGAYGSYQNFFFYVGEHFVVDGCLYQTHGYYDQVVLKDVSSEAIHNGVLNIPEYVSYGGKSYYVKWILEGAFEENGTNIEKLYVNTNTPPELLKDGLAGLPETCDIYVPSYSQVNYEEMWGRTVKTFVGKDVVFTAPVPVTKNGTTSQVDMTFKVTSTGANPTVQVGNDNDPSINTSTQGAVVIPETVTYSGETFTVTSLSQYAFNYNQSVTSITLPSTITEIKKYAVYYCYNLERLYLQSEVPNTNIADYAFSSSNTDNCILVVPVGSKTAYQNSVWSSIFPYIKEVGHETEWLPGDVFWAEVFFGDDCEKYVPFKIITAADGDTPATVQMGLRDYDNTEPLDEVATEYSIFYYNNYCPDVVTIPESVQFKGEAYTITTLGAYVFSSISSYSNNNEYKFVLPASITTIGFKAFKYECMIQNLYLNSETAPTLIIGDDPDDDDPAPFGSWFKTGYYDEYYDANYEGCNLFVPDGCVEAYEDWAPYFKSILETPKPVVICGVEYKSETDIFGDGTAVIRWEFEENDDIKKSNTKGGSDEDYAEYLYKYGYPVLTLNNANINYTGNGPAIEVNTFGKFYIRVKGTNTITAANAAAAISIGTNKGVDLSQTSLVFLSDEVPENQGGGIVVDPGLQAPRHKARKAGAGSSNMLPSLTITNSTTNGDGIYVYQGSCNVQDCDVTVTGQKYGLEFGTSGTSGTEIGGGVDVANAPRRNAKGGPKKVTPVDNSYYDADDDYYYNIQYPGWLNIFEGSGLTLNGSTAALWGALGPDYYYNNYYNYNYKNIPGYFQNVYLQETDKSTYEAVYTTVEGPYYYYYDPESSYEDERGTYTFWMTNAEEPYSDDAEWTMAYAKYLKFGCDYFIATTDEGIRMKFKPLNENTCQVGDYDEQSDRPITAIDQETYGSVTIPSEVNGYQVTSICKGAFYECEDITAISIPATVNNIGVMAFGDCESLSTVTCYATNPPTLETQTNDDDTYTPFSFAGGKDGMILYVPANSVDAYTNPTAGWGEYFTQILPIGGEGYVFTAKTIENVMLTYMVLGTENGVTKVQVGTGNTHSVVSAPDNWDGNLTIPATVTDAGGNGYKVEGIADYAFYNISSLKSVTISEGVGFVGTGQSNGYGAFQSCGYLTSVTLPSTIERVNSWAFQYCYSLSEVNLYATDDIPTLGQSYAFYNNPTLYVPDESVNAYQTAWGGSGYFSQILGMSQKPFTAQTPEGIALKFYIISDNIVQLGNGQSSAVVFIPNNWNGQLTVPATVTNGNGNEYDVKVIGDKALYDWYDLRSVTISEGIEYIGTNTAGWGAFENDQYLETVYLPSSTLKLDNWCFSSCGNIKDVYLIAEAVPSLNGNTFSSSSAILHVPAGTKVLYDASAWAQYFGYGERIVEMEDMFFTANVNGVDMTFKVTGENTVQTYGYYYFDDDKNFVAVPAIPLNSTGVITIPETVTYEDVTYTVTAIGEMSFSTTNIEGVTIPSTITNIGEGAFYYCTSLTSVTIPASVNIIGDYAFQSCTSLTSVTCYAVNPPSIDEDAFYGIPPVTTLYVPTVDAISSYQNSYWSYFFNKIRVIGDNSFGVGDTFVANNDQGVPITYMVTGAEEGNCTVQTFGYWDDPNDCYVPAIPSNYSGSLTIPETATHEGVTYTVTKIGNDSFDAWELPLNLTEVTIPSTITYIGVGAFYGCTGLTSITIPASVSSIGNYAFEDCDNVAEVTCYAVNPPSMGGGYVFDGIKSDAILYVSAGTKALYDASDWAQYFSNIVEIGGAPATVPVTISSAGMATFSSEYALDFTNSDVKAYIVSVFSPEDHQLTLTRLDKVPAQTGLLLKGVQGSYNIPTTNYTAGTANMLKPILEDIILQPTEGDYTNFVLTRYNGNVGFYRFAQSQNYSAGKAYLQILTSLVEQANQNGVKGFVLNFDDEDDPTAISVIEEESTDDEIYNIAGQRMNKAQKGINIMNGKKVLVK